METREMLEKLGERNLEPHHALLYRASSRTFAQVGWLSKELMKLLERMLEITGEETF